MRWVWERWFRKWRIQGLGFSGSGWNVGAKKEEEERVKEGEGVLSGAGPAEPAGPVYWTGLVLLFFSFFFLLSLAGFY